jgi:hypothetical protein
MDFSIIEKLSGLVGPYAALVTLGIVAVWLRLGKCQDRLLSVQKEANESILAVQKAAQEAVIVAYKLRGDDISEIITNVTRSIEANTQSGKDLTVTIGERTAMISEQNALLRDIKDHTESNHPYWQGRIGGIEEAVEKLTGLVSTALKGVQRLLAAARIGSRAPPPPALDDPGQGSR